MSDTALQMADELDRLGSQYDSEIAAELRRLHALNAELVEALKTCVCAMQDYQAGIGITEMFDKGERMGHEALKKMEASNG